MISKYFIYVLFNYSHQRFYTGSSSDPYKRLKSHNDPRNRGWTRRFTPWVLIHIEKFNNKHEALLREKWLKTGAGRKFIKKIHHNSE
jgi:putative endonuclease